MPLKNGGDAGWDRAALLDAVLAELASLSPERMGLFRVLQRGSVSLIHAHLVMLLDVGGPLSMGQIADLLDVSVASATGIVDRLEKRGMVRRHRDEDDRRVVRVVPTDQARELVVEMHREHRDRLRAVLQELTDEELRGFRSALGAMRRARERHLAEGGIAILHPHRHPEAEE